MSPITESILVGLAVGFVVLAVTLLVERMPRYIAVLLSNFCSWRYILRGSNHVFRRCVIVWPAGLIVALQT